MTVCSGLLGNAFKSMALVRIFFHSTICVLILLTQANAQQTSVPSDVESVDRHSGYYYPPPQTTEIFEARVPAFPQASRRSRLAFVTGLTTAQNNAPYPPSFHVFAKGGEADKLIVSSVDSTRYRTLYQFRALLAAMTALARNTPVFQDESTPDTLTFLDLCKMMGVRQLTITDGVSVTHQISIR